MVTTVTVKLESAVTTLSSLVEVLGLVLSLSFVLWKCYAVRRQPKTLLDPCLLRYKNSDVFMGLHLLSPC